MIRLYRVIRYPDVTLITFRGDADDIEPLADIFHVAPRASRSATSYEKGHYAYLRGDWRNNNEYQAVQYLKHHYLPPDIELLVFKGDRQLSNKHSREDWAKLLESEIRDYFSNKGNITKSGSLNYEVYGKRPFMLAPNQEPVLHAYVGVTYKIYINDIYIPTIKVDISYCYRCNNEFFREAEIRQKFSENVKDISERIKAFTTRDTDYIFKLAGNFVINLPSLSTEKLKFEPHFLSPAEFESVVWLWSHDAPVSLLVGNNQVVTQAKSIFEYKMGLFKPPSNPILVVMVYPSKDIKCNSFYEWMPIYRLIEEKLSVVLPSTPIIFLEYNFPDTKDTAQICEEVLKAYDGIAPLYFVFAPPEDSHKSKNKELVAVDEYTRQLEYKLRKLRYGGYTVTLHWNNMANKHERPYALENAILKGLAVMGAVPWRIEHINHNPAESLEDLSFIGVDLNIFKKFPVVGGVIFDGYGIPKGYHLARITNKFGDKIPEETFSLLINRLIKHYQRLTNSYPKHVIIHRDGIAREDFGLAIKNIIQKDITIDFIEVVKSGVPRIRQIDNDMGTPSRDIAIGNEQLSEAFLVNNLAVKEYLNGSPVLPAPEPIRIRRIYGDTPIKILASQVYALSLANYNSARRTDSRPITIAYADSLVNNASLKEEQSNFGKTIDDMNRAYWL